MLEDMGKLVKQNRELNDACAQMDDEIHYHKLREKKIMYLVHLLQNMATQSRASTRRS